MLLATVVSVLIGVAVGILSAIRQYSSFDYSSTFAAFLFFSLPVFWLAVLLKQFGAIEFNDWLEHPSVGGIGLAVAGGPHRALLGHRRRRVPTTTPARRPRRAAVASVAFLLIIEATGWLENPGLSPLVPRHRAAGRRAVVGTLALRRPREPPRPRARPLIGAAGVAASSRSSSATGSRTRAGRSWRSSPCCRSPSPCVGGVAFGGIDRRPRCRRPCSSAFLVGALVVVDRFLSTWAPGPHDRHGRPADARTSRARSGSG